jgi:hypothetical protein
MISAALLSALALFQSSPGEAELGPVFGNTLVSTYPDGRTARLWMKSGGTYDGVGRRGEHTSGVWRVRDDRVCFSQRRPIPMPGSYCTPIVRGGVGARWTARAVTGETIQVQLVAGR